MPALNSRHLLIGLTMFAAAGLALALTPRPQKADPGPKINLEAMIPTQFGAWKLDETIPPLMIKPELQSAVDKLYSQTLNRAYLNSQGERILLSIAYSSDQGYSSQVHRPEMCYPAQGFQIGGTSKAVIDTGMAKFPVMRLVATQGKRIEPITYWVMIGDISVRGNVEQHFARVKYGLGGKIPSGMVIRVSTISANESHSYRIEDQFVRAMLGAVSVKHRKVLAGAG